MADWLTTVQEMRSRITRQTGLRFASVLLLAASLSASPAFAKDPFRTTNTRPISDRTEAAFKAFFQQGNYVTAANYLKQADGKDPLTMAMRASLSFVNWQGEADQQKKAALLEQFRSESLQTRDVAQQMMGVDPLRGNLYLAVGHFLEGAYVLSKEGTVKGTPQVLGSLQQAFKYLDAAEKQDRNDPELNLVKGYIDLFTALNLPFSSPNDALERLNKYAAPRYLADRGIAIGYRDLNQPAKAMAAVDRALQATPENPELLYLKAQILVRQGNNRESIPYFEQALAKKDQLPAGLVKEMTRGLRKTKQRLEAVGR